MAHFRRREVAAVVAAVDGAPFAAVGTVQLHRETQFRRRPGAAASAAGRRPPTGGVRKQRC